MIGPSDLNRIPRWSPARIPEDLHRYVRTELGGESFDRGTEIRAATSPPGLFARLAMRLRTGGPAAPRSLAAELGAVHFAGETRAAPLAAEHIPAACAIAASALVIPAGSRKAGSEELSTCEQ